MKLFYIILILAYLKIKHHNLYKRRFYYFFMITQGVLIEGFGPYSFIVEKGLAKAILPEEGNKDYYKWARTKRRGFDTALEERIKLPFESGLLVVRNPDGSIKFDDRKLRFSGYSKRGDQYVLQVAPTHFGEIKATDIRAAMSPEFEKYLLEKSLTDFGEEMAYFACSIAVNAVPITKEGYVHVFRRSDTQELYPGRWDVIGGFVEVGDRIFDFYEGDMSKKFAELVNYNAKKEFVEETGIDYNLFNLTGLVRGANFVFTHEAFLDMSTEEFLARFSKTGDSSEIGRVLVLKSSKELSGFLESEKANTSPTAYHALRLHLKNRL